VLTPNQMAALDEQINKDKKELKELKPGLSPIRQLPTGAIINLMPKATFLIGADYRGLAR